MSTQTGREAEAAAAAYLRRHGFTVLAQNWRTRWCEIDIVASKNGTVYVVEVKYRRTLTWGSGFDYVTHRKLRQMQFAAHFWMARNQPGADICLAAMELTGEPPYVTRWAIV